MRTLAFSLLFLIGQKGFGQYDSLIRYWVDGYETHSPQTAKTRAVYTYWGGIWKMESRFLSTGTVYMTASYSDRDAKKKQGLFRWYYENGQMSQEASYENNELEGLKRVWTGKGLLTDSAWYRKGVRTGRTKQWTDEGKLAAEYELNEEGNGTARLYRGGDTLTAEGSFLRGRRQGEWTYYRDPARWTVHYEKDSVTRVSCFNADGTPGSTCIFEQDAMPAGGLAGWKKFLMKELGSLQYPSRQVEKAYPGHVFGTCSARFIVEKDGTLSDIQIIESVNPVVDALVVDLLKRCPPWQPAIQFNQPVRAYRTQPVTFASRE